MNYFLTVQNEAEFDIKSIFEYYENWRLGLGHDFLHWFEEGLSKIECNLFLIYKELRRIAIRRFPYRIFYLIQDKQIIVTAVFHVRNDLLSWESHR